MPRPVELESSRPALHNQRRPARQVMLYGWHNYSELVLPRIWCRVMVLNLDLSFRERSLSPSSITEIYHHQRIV